MNDGERRGMFCHFGGMAGGLEEFAKMLREESGRLFADGQDDRAKIVRYYVGWAVMEAQKARAEQEKYAAGRVKEARDA